jgi:ADP-ribosylglycohydrolase
MRILPLLFYIKDKSIKERFQITQEVSSLTHRHIRSVIGCFIYLEMALHILLGKGKWEAFKLMVRNVNHFLSDNKICSQKEIDIYHRILGNPIDDNEIKPLYEFDEEEIYSSGYILHTLEASIWCLLKTDNYKNAVLKAVNLGNDTDTTGAVTGGLAGLLYGVKSIPSDWIDVLARKEDVEELAERLHQRLN